MRLFLLLLLSPLIIGAQQSDEDYVNDKVMKYYDHVYLPDIRTVLLHPPAWETGPPTMALSSADQLRLSFDDLGEESAQYSMSFVHCNYDWTPSDLSPSEYLSGMSDLHVNNYSFSANTYQKYIHFSITFPGSNDVKFTKSGNYVLYVYRNDNKDDLVLTRRFMVYEDRVQVKATFRQQAAGEDVYRKQHMDFTITSNGYDITNPYKDLHVVLTQNNRWDNAVLGIKPTFLNGNELVYSLDDASTFNGGNEFRYFDIRSLRFLTERVMDVTRDKDLHNQVRLQPDEIRRTRAYLSYGDLNGGFAISSKEGGNPETEADYVFVHFFLPYKNPEADGNIYIMGKLTNWTMNQQSMMKYNYERAGYEATLFLKQGYYNYIYVKSSDEKKEGDESLIEGSHWETENIYHILVYHRKFGTYYDQLITCKPVSSH